MRWLIVLGLAVAACSGSGSDGPSNLAAEAGDGGEASPGAGKPTSAGAAAIAGAHAYAGESGTTGDGGAGEAGAAGESSSGALGGAGGAAAGEAGQGGEVVLPTGGTSAGTGGATPGGSSGAGGTGGTGGKAGAGGSAGSGGSIVTPDPCEGVLPWDPTVPYTELKKDELRTLQGQLWKCTSPAFCTTHPGHETAPGWMKVDDCADPNEGGEPACQCEEGACCDGCFFRPRSHLCGEDVRYADCGGGQVCGGEALIHREYWNLFCAGDGGSNCTRWGASTKSNTTSCPGNTACVESGDQASCVACPN